MGLPDLGRRGGGWVVGQFVLIGCVLVVAWQGQADDPRPRTAGYLVTAAGIALGVWAWAALGSGLTPYPRPRDSSVLVSRGPYAMVRHPMYLAVLLILGGVCLRGSPWSLIPLLLLLGWWVAKVSVEERFLRATHPDYADYARRVRWRIVPGIV